MPSTLHQYQITYHITLQMITIHYHIQMLPTLYIKEFTLENHACRRTVQRKEGSGNTKSRVVTQKNHMILCAIANPLFQTPCKSRFIT